MADTEPLRRSMLYLAGAYPEMLGIYPRFPADLFCFDLEDGTPPADKVAARERIAEVLRTIPDGAGRERLLRVNGLDTPWGHDDLRAAARATFAYLLVRGLLVLAFGILALLWAGPTGKGIIYVFAIFSIIDGVLGFVLRGQSWGWVVFSGVLGIVIGIIAFRWPAAIGLALILLIAMWALIIGSFQIAGSFTLKSLGDSGWYWTLIAGLVAVALGVLMLLNPSFSAKTIVVIIGIFAIAYGLFQIIGAFSVRKLTKEALAG